MGVDRQGLHLSVFVLPPGDCVHPDPSFLMCVSVCVPLCECRVCLCTCMWCLCLSASLGSFLCVLYWFVSLHVSVLSVCVVCMCVPCMCVRAGVRAWCVRAWVWRVLPPRRLPKAGSVRGVTVPRRPPRSAAGGEERVVGPRPHTWAGRRLPRSTPPAAPPRARISGGADAAPCRRGAGGAQLSGLVLAHRRRGPRSGTRQRRSWPGT